MNVGEPLESSMCECAACQQRHKPLAPATEQDQKTYRSIADNFWNGKRITELESALAKSASREAALVEKLKVSEAALVSINRATADGQAFDAFVISRAALAKIKEAS